VTVLSRLTTGSSSFMPTCPRCQTDHSAGGGKCPADAAPAAAERGQICTVAADIEARDPLLHTKVGSWTILEVIGGGGMGTVYLAKNLDIDAQVAVKVMKLDAIVQGKRDSTLEDDLRLARERFLREAKILAQLGKNDPGIVQILDYGHLPDGRPYMVMEYLYGRPLDQWLGQGLPPVHDLWRWLLQLCDALASIHGAGVVHRDLKPENIWIVEPKTGPSSVKLIDFGISKAAAHATLTKVGEIAGSPGYMSPERICDSPGDLRSDLYAFGVLLYEIVTGRLPFTADSLVALAVKVKYDPPPALVPRAGFVLPAGLETLIRDCLAKEPAKRPQSALELKQRLLDAVRGQDEIASEVERPVPARAPVEPDAAHGTETAVYLTVLARARRRRIAVGLLVALALAGAGYVLWSRAKDRVDTYATPAPIPASPPLAPAALPAPAVLPSPAASLPSAPAAQPVARPSAVRARGRVASGRAGDRKPSQTENPSSPLQPEPQAAPREETTPPPAAPSAAARAPEIVPSVPAAGDMLEWIPKRPSRPLSPSERDLITDEKTLIGR
jgi:serine/threonine protein kinase